MWKQYKKTFVGMQILIGAVTFGLLLWSHRLYVCAAFFGTMQLGSIFGAIWGARLKNMFSGQSYGLPPRKI